MQLCTHSLVIMMGHRISNYTSGGLAMGYKTINEIPEKYLIIVQRLVEQGIIGCSDELEYPLTEDMLYLLKILTRKGML